MARYEEPVVSIWDLVPLEGYLPARKHDILVGYTSLQSCREKMQKCNRTLPVETEITAGPRSPRYHFMANLMVQSYNANATNAEPPFYAVSILSASSSFLSSFPALASPS